MKIKVDIPCENCGNHVRSWFWLIFYHLNMQPILHDLKKLDMPLPMYCWKCYFSMPVALIYHWILTAIKEIRE